MFPYLYWTKLTFWCTFEEVFLWHMWNSGSGQSGLYTFRLTVSQFELTKDHVLLKAYVIIECFQSSGWQKERFESGKDCFKSQIECFKSSGCYFSTFSMFPAFSMFSMFSQLTPCSPIRNGRMEQFVKPCLCLIQPSSTNLFDAKGGHGIKKNTTFFFPKTI